MGGEGYICSEGTYVLVGDSSHIERVFGLVVIIITTETIRFMNAFTARYLSKTSKGALPTHLISPRMPATFFLVALPLAIRCSSAAARSLRVISPSDIRW